MTRKHRRHAPFGKPEVAEAFGAVPAAPRAQLMRLRELIFDTAAKTHGVGPIEEALRWGEPSYLTTETKSGTAIRIHWKAKQPGHCALYVHCQTHLLERFRLRHGDELLFEGNRAVLFPVDRPLPVSALRDCIQLALTYHRH